MDGEMSSTPGSGADPYFWIAGEKCEESWNQVHLSTEEKKTLKCIYFFTLQHGTNSTDKMI